MNWELIETLLNVIHAASTAGPKYAKVVALAADQLELEIAPPAEETAEEDAA